MNIKIKKEIKNPDKAQNQDENKKDVWYIAHLDEDDDKKVKLKLNSEIIKYSQMNNNSN